MNNFHAEPFDLKHIPLLHLREWERENIKPEEIGELAANAEMWTLFADDTVLAIVGYMRKWADVFEVFVFPSIHTDKYPVFYVYKIRRYLDEITKTFGMRRIQTISIADETTDRWMRALKFKCEGTLQGYTANALDCRMWARVKS